MALEIDQTAINKKLRIVNDETQESALPWLQSDISKVLPRPHKRVEPFPGACIKTWTEDGLKLFINVCHSKEIIPPEDISDEKFAKLIDEDVPSFVIPMAIGLEKMAKDKEDIERPTFDILINTNYFEKCMKKNHFWQFSIAALLESINDKYNKNINPTKYVVLKNRKVMGSLDPFTIEDREPRKPIIKKPLIQELDSSNILDSKKIKKKSEIVCTKSNTKDMTNTKLRKENDNSTDKSNTSVSSNEEPNKKEKIIERRVIEEQDENQNFTFLKSENNDNLLGFFYFPALNSTDIVIDVGENQIIIDNQKAETVVDTFLPYSINNTKVTADFDSVLHILRLTLPLKK